MCSKLSSAHCGIFSERAHIFHLFTARQRAHVFHLFTAGERAHVFHLFTAGKRAHVFHLFTAGQRAHVFHLFTVGERGAWTCYLLVFTPVYLQVFMTNNHSTSCDLPKMIVIPIPFNY